MKEIACVVVVLSVIAAASLAEESGADAGEQYTVATYYWPCFHADPFHESKLGEGWTEWKLVREAKPKFAGHYQPKVSLWGERDESDPKVMAHAIDAMADHGIDVLIFDWYRYDDDIHGGEMLERALRKGFLGAPNRDRVKFALMWANHNYIDCFPFKPGKSFGNAEVWRPGVVSRESFDRHMDDALKSYFSRPNYWKIDGAPYFSFYDLDTLIRGLGGLSETSQAIDAFQRRAKAAGFPRVHVNIVTRHNLPVLELVKGQPMPGDPSRKVETAADLMNALDVDSVTWYTWAHHVRTEGDYRPYGEKSVAAWDAEPGRYGVPFFPHVSAGWDGTPRNYSMGVVTNNTPEAFRMFLEKAKAWVDAHPKARGIVTLNSWNEWVEGSYVEPDTLHGTNRLEALRDVFGTSGAAK